MSRRTVSALLVIVFTALACAGVALTTARASAVFHELTETGRPGYLTLALDSETPLRAALAPGESMRWLVEASLRGAPSSSLAVELQAGGELVAASGMTAEVATCSAAFDLAATPAACAGSATIVLPATPLAQIARHGDRYELAALRRGEPRQVLVTLGIPSSTPAAALDGRTARVGLGLHAAGEDPDTTVVPVDPLPPTDPRLAVTGADALALGLLAAGLVGLGTLAAIRARARSAAPPAAGGPR